MYTAAVACKEYGYGEVSEAGVGKAVQWATLIRPFPLPNKKTETYTKSVH